VLARNAFVVVGSEGNKTRIARFREKREVRKEGKEERRERECACASALLATSIATNSPNNLSTPLLSTLCSGTPA
jgi:hypothetical protein